MTLIGSAGALAVCSIAGSYWLVFGATIVFFMLTSILRPAINTLISEIAGDEQGFAAGMNIRVDGPCQHCRTDSGRSVIRCERRNSIYFWRGRSRAELFGGSQLGAEAAGAHNS